MCSDLGSCWMLHRPVLRLLSVALSNRLGHAPRLHLGSSRCGCRCCLRSQDALDLPLLRTLKSLTVAWSTLTLLAGMPQLQLISQGSLTVRDNALLTNVSLPGLVRVSASVTLQRNGALLGVSLPVGRSC